ncbi:MAG: hypothetical protein M0Z69_00280 [Actinomycetota bacterium]|nr:hypothetical protein [Actinomycetota bacterium]
MDEEGESFEVSACPSERHGLRQLVVHVREPYAGEEVMAVIESMRVAHRSDLLPRRR